MSMNATVAAAAAAAAAAALRARLAAAGKLTPAPSNTLLINPPAMMAPQAAPTVTSFNMEIEINDKPTRSILTRGPKQDEIGEKFGVSVTTRGRYYPPNEKPKSKPSAVQERPLHLYLEGSNQESLEKAKAHILQILDGKGRDEAGKPYTAAATGGFYLAAPQVRAASAKVWLDIHAPAGSGFDTRAKVMGPNGAYLEHIAKESTCKVELHGRGSGHIDPQTNQEAPESMHIYLEHADKNSLAKGKELCINLVTTIREEFNEWCKQPPVVPYSVPPATGYYGQPPQSYHPPYQPPPPHASIYAPPYNAPAPHPAYGTPVPPAMASYGAPPPPQWGYGSVGYPAPTTYDMPTAVPPAAPPGVSPQYPPHQTPPTSTAPAPPGVAPPPPPAAPTHGLADAPSTTSNASGAAPDSSAAHMNTPLAAQTTPAPTAPIAPPPPPQAHVQSGYAPPAAYVGAYYPPPSGGPGGAGPAAAYGAPPTLPPGVGNGSAPFVTGTGLYGAPAAPPPPPPPSGMTPTSSTAPPPSAPPPRRPTATPSFSVADAFDTSSGPKRKFSEKPFGAPSISISSSYYSSAETADSSEGGPAKKSKVAAAPLVDYDED